MLQYDLCNKLQGRTCTNFADFFFLLQVSVRISTSSVVIINGGPSPIMIYSNISTQVNLLHSACVQL